MPDDPGPRRDGRYVVATASSPMPRRCMVCATPVPALREETFPVPRRTPARGVVGTALFLLGPRFTVRYGRCAAHRVRWAKVVGTVAGLAVIVGPLGTVGSLMATNGRFAVSECAFGLLFVGSFVAIVWARFADLSLGKVRGGAVWIGGFGEPYPRCCPPAIRPSHNQPLLWTAPRRGCIAFYSSAPPGPSRVRPQSGVRQGTWTH